MHVNHGSRSRRAGAGLITLYKCLPIRRNIELPSSFAGFLPWFGVRRWKDSRRGLRPHAMSLVRCLYNRCETPATDSATSPSIRCERGALAGSSRLLRCHTDNRGVNWDYSKISNRNSILQGNLDHKRVLFVQHPLEKGRSQAARSGSFVACAEVLGNCDQATEGGIPRSSRFRWFA